MVKLHEIAEYPPETLGSLVNYETRPMIKHWGINMYQPSGEPLEEAPRYLSLLPMDSAGAGVENSCTWPFLRGKECTSTV